MITGARSRGFREIGMDAGVLIKAMWTYLAKNQILRNSINY